MSENLNTILGDLDSLVTTFDADLQSAESLSTLEEVRVKYIGRKGALPKYFKKMSELTAEEKPQLGDRLNSVKAELLSKLDERKASFAERPKATGIADLSLPGTAPEIGFTNPLIAVLEEIKTIFQTMGFTIEVGPEVE
ncbi:phenylalanine--tRNA ligase subunit alpha, partial [bacterium]|nr:phenylalanine--tRNA ligase subunit alpha [bacterium]